VLSGKYSKELTEPPKGSRIDWATTVNYQDYSWKVLNNEATWTIVDALNEIAQQVGKTPAQVKKKEKK
jgi:aryl-alcohol dehydrogenase-like predicted oxidoreductase